MCRHFTSQVSGLADMDYWDRLSMLQIYSQERRRERYAVIFIWEIDQQLVKGYTLEFSQHPRRGRLAAVHHVPSNLPPDVAKAREASLPVKGSNSSTISQRDSETYMGLSYSSRQGWTSA